jgi:glycosyltransferase involved in cell wall biosynthesis
MNPGGRFILVVTHLFPYPPSHGTELRIFKLLKALSAEGYRVVLVLCTEPGCKQHLNELKQFVDAVEWVQPAWRTKLGRRLPGLRRLIWPKLKPVIRRVWSPHDIPEPADLFDVVPSTVGDERKKRAVVPPQLAVLVAKLARKYKPICVIAEYIFLTDCFALLTPGVLKIVDTIDVFSLRDKQVVRYGIEDDPWNCAAEEERTYLLRADAIIAIQEREANILRELVPERQVVTVGLDFEVDDSISSELGKPDTITVVASDCPLNVHGLSAFLAECWPLIKAAHPAARLHVVGNIGARVRVGDPATSYTLRSENLRAVYRRSRVVINPTIAGTGIKAKSAEALSHGKPLVAWPLGVDGLDYRGDAPYVICESWEDFAAAVVRILQSDTEAQALSERALEYAKDRFHPASVYTPLTEYLRADEPTNIEPNSRRLSLSTQ